MSTIPHSVSLETRNIINSIRRLVQSIRVASRDSEKKVGLSAAQLFVLQKLKEEHGLSLNDLAERTLTHQSSVSVVIKRLVEKDLVRRERSDEDGRQLVLGITPKGRRLLVRAPHAKQDWLITALEQMKPVSRKRFDRAFTELLELSGLAKKGYPPLLFAETGPNKLHQKKNK
ncbi:MAG TPA: MarR family transcriptional regulator [Candidatus Kapabacteria bacterium]|nr:MarR family transcriptional regulator [Candidatus Kapabacteria bacterium]